MPAPVLANRNAFYVNYVGTDDAGYNAIGAPWSYKSISAALAALALVANPPSAANPWIISIGPGVFVEPSIALPPWVWLTGSPDGEAGGPTVIQLAAGNIMLTSGWNLNTTARGGLANLVIRPSSGTPSIDLTMPVPAAGNPSRTVEIQNVRTNLDLINFQATGTGDALQVDNLVQDSTLADFITLMGGIISLNQMQSAAEVTLTSGAVIPMAARITASQIPQIVVTKGAAALTVAFDAVSWPVIGSVTLVGGPTLTRLSDANGEGYTPAVPGNWPVVPATVQQALDELAASGGAEQQSGTIALVNGQQSYPLVFATPFAVAPTKLIAAIEMATNAGELFIVGVDLSTVTTLGCTFWLNGVPTAASTGGKIAWLAF